jgi:hypothetical protein
MPDRPFIRFTWHVPAIGWKPIQKRGEQLMYIGGGIVGLILLILLILWLTGNLG